MLRFDINKVDLSIDSAHTKLIKLVGENKKVLEVGCSTGYVSKVLTEQNNCTITGIEVASEAANKAAKFCSRIITGDVELMDYSKELAAEQFDVITFGDVLEHLKNPGNVLTSLKPFLKNNGYLIASIPNIGHISIVLELLEGKFDYRSSGVLDDTHLRFFTKDGIQRLFNESGLDIVHWDRVIIKPEETEFKTVLNKCYDNRFWIFRQLFQFTELQV